MNDKINSNYNIKNLLDDENDPVIINKLVIQNYSSTNRFLLTENINHLQNKF